MRRPSSICDDIEDAEYCELAEALARCTSPQEAERLLWTRMMQLLSKAKQNCRPEFAERLEAWMTQHGYLAG